MVHDLTVSSWFSLRHLSDHDKPKPLLCKIIGHKKHWIKEITCEALNAKIYIFRCDRESSYFLEIKEDFLGMGPDEHYILQIKQETYHAIDQIMNDWDGSKGSFMGVVINIGKILALNLQWIHLGLTTPLSQLFQKHGDPAYDQYQKTGDSEGSNMNSKEPISRKDLLTLIMMIPVTLGLGYYLLYHFTFLNAVLSVFTWVMVFMALVFMAGQ